MLLTKTIRRNSAAARRETQRSGTVDVHASERRTGVGTVVAQDVSAGRKMNHRISALQRAGDRDFIRQLGNQSSIATESPLV